MSILLLLQLIWIWRILQLYSTILVASNSKVSSVSICVHGTCHYGTIEHQPQVHVLGTTESLKESILIQMSSSMDCSTGLPALHGSYVHVHRYSAEVLHNLRTNVGVRTCPFSEKTCLTLHLYKLQRTVCVIHSPQIKPRRRRTRRGCSGVSWPSG